MTSLRIAHASSFSRGKSPPSFAMFPRANEGSGAPTGARVLARHPSRASNVGPQGEIARASRPAQTAYAVRAPGTPASRRSTAAIYWLRARLGDAFGRCLARRCPRLRMGAFARSARSGGRAVLPGRLPGAWLRASPQDAASRSRLWLVSGDALGERDGPHIGARGNSVKDKFLAQRTIECKLARR